MKIYFYNVSCLERAKIKKVLNVARRTLRQPNCLEVNISFVDIEQIQQLNNQTRQQDKPTDVLSFPTFANPTKGKINPKFHQLDQNPQTGKIIIGDIVICRQIALKHANEYHHSIMRELCFLALHGFLHLLGFDHIEEHDQAEMSQIQEKILSRCGILRK